MSFNRRGRKLFDALTQFDGELVAALFTTYNFDGQYFETTLLPKILGVRVDDDEDERIAAVDIFHKLSQIDVVVVADGKVNKANRVKNLYGYDFIPVFGATQHSKISLLQFEDGFRLIVGSGNLTESGLHRNREIYVEIDFTEESADWKLLFSVLDYLDVMSAANDNRFSRVAAGFRKLAEKLSSDSDVEPNMGLRFVGVTPDNGKLSFSALLKQFFREFDIRDTGGQRVDEIFILSPFYEAEIKNRNSDGANTLLSKEYYDLKGDQRLLPHLYLYMPVRGENISTLFPQVGYSKLLETLGDKLIIFKNPETMIVDKREQVRFPHGKLYAITNWSKYVMTVLGSSNFSPSAFGKRSRGLNNWEANIAFFVPEYSKSALKAMFPEDNEIEDEVWTTQELVEEDCLEDPDCALDELVVLVDAVYKDGKLKVESNINDVSQFKYLVGQLHVDINWIGRKGTFEGKVSSTSIEIRDENDVLIQDLPIHFDGEADLPFSLTISSTDMSNWIESRYLCKRQLPLSALLEKFQRKEARASGRLSSVNVSTEDFLIYRVKVFNSLVTRVHEKILEQRDHAKRVEYHLIGKFGLINCIKEYVETAKTADLEVFSIYQAVEVASSVISAFDTTVSDDSLSILRVFWAQISDSLKGFQPQSEASIQIFSYIEELQMLVNRTLAAR